MQEERVRSSFFHALRKGQATMGWERRPMTVRLTMNGGAIDREWQCG